MAAPLANVTTALVQRGEQVAVQGLYEGFAELRPLHKIVVGAVLILIGYYVVPRFFPEQR